MGSFKLDESTKRKLEDIGRKEANRLADDAKKKLIDKYNFLINKFYKDYTPAKDRHGEFYYTRTFNLFKSYRAYKRNPHNTIYYGGVEITADRMNDYESIVIGEDGLPETFPAERLLEKYIYTTSLPSATWHGGDWHGGYGVMAKFSIYNEMMKYKDYLIKYYTKNNGIKK